MALKRKRVIPQDICPLIKAVYLLAASAMHFDIESINFRITTSATTSLSARSFRDLCDHRHAASVISCCRVGAAAVVVALLIVFLSVTNLLALTIVATFSLLFRPKK
jgi:hypothetical protein